MPLIGLSCASCSLRPAVSRPVELALRPDFNLARASARLKELQPMKDYHLCGLGNAIVDIFVEVSDDEFAALGFERGTMRLVDLDEQQKLLDRFHDREPRLVSGGSVGNSVIALSQLGGQAAFIGCVGDDRYGLFYTSECEGLKDRIA